MSHSVMSPPQVSDIFSGFSVAAPVLCSDGVVWFLRAPESAPLKSKMIYASSKDAIKKKFTGESPCGHRKSPV